MKTIIEWFDPWNISHMRAYIYLEDKSYWPKDFIPKDIIFPNTWRIELINKIADCWIEHFKDKFIYNCRNDLWG